ncbi:MAG: right-handed parallel beta-helix repeat-containing protein [Verrucomicrobia bacterium]|nr:right-handed parallel beta-helix repeat-containing protein [Verrucomicrobiota bacterium]
MLLILVAGLISSSASAATLVVTTTADSGPGSLRQAILNANASVPADTITFKIPGAPPFKISPTSSLPTVFLSPLVLDGTTQPGYSDRPIIEIDGSLAGAAGVDGIELGTPGCVIRGLAINRFSQSGIRISARSNKVERCFVGTDATGTQARGNGYRGIWLTPGGDFATIRSNLVSGNLGHGIDLGTSATNALQHNLIGTDITGAQPLGNWEAGVFISGASLGQALGNRVGGDQKDEGNTIAFNKMVGVFVSRSTLNAILGNSIFGNGGIGIDLSKSAGTADGPTRNDPGDGDKGGNLGQNFPEIAQVTHIAGNTLVAGALDSAAGKQYRLEFFSNPNPRPTFILSEGREWLGSTNVTTDANGKASFQAMFAGLATNVTATATDPDDNTSEYSTLNPPLPPATPQLGDLFVSIDGSRIQWRRADGTPVKELRTGAATAAAPQGLALDPAGNLFATTVDGRSVVKFDVNGNPIGTNTSGILFNTIGVRLDALGNQWVGLDNGDLMKFSPEGSLMATLSFGKRTRFDVAADQQTLLFSPSISTVRRYDIANEFPLSDFATLSGPQVLDINILPDQQVLVANANLIALLSRAGATLRLFGQSSVPQGWSQTRALPDAKSFWAAGNGAFLNRFNIATGALLDRMYIEYQVDPLNSSSQQLGPVPTFAIRGGFNAANSGMAIASSDNADPVSAGAKVAYSVTVVNNTGAAVANVVVTNLLPVGATFTQATTSQGSFSQAEGRVVFSLGTVPTGATARMTVQVTPLFAGTITNSARMIGDGLSSSSADYLSLQTTLVVDGPASPTVVLTTNDSGPGSLRKAIQNANNRAGLDVITFNIPGGGVHTLRPVAALPLITSPVIIDGYTQPGSRSNSLASGHNGALMIEIDGSQAAGGSANGLTLLSGGAGSVVRGLVINRFGGSGVALLSSTAGARIEGNFIGVDASGMNAAPNNTGGITLNDVHTPTSADEPTLIGGLTPDKRNLISGNNNVGVFVFGASSSRVRIQGNAIGTDRTGAAPLPNLGPGISESAPDCVIGGTDPGAGNTIAFNSQAGVTLGGRAAGVSILRNSIHSNGALGIVGSFVGPRVTGATPGASSVSGFLLGAPSKQYLVEVFANDACDPTGFGEGRDFIGANAVTTDPSGASGFSIPVSLALPAGRFITATATDEDGNTSLFSHCTQTGPANDLSIAQSVSASPLPARSNVVFTVTVSNAGPTAATGVSMGWEIPTGFTYVSGASGVQSSGGRATASATILAAGTATNWSIVVRPNQIDVVISAFSVAGDQPDPNAANNLSIVSLNVVNPAQKTWMVTNTNASGAGSLSQAILDANGGPGGDSIAFNVPGPTPHTITTTYVPAVTVPVTIDGFTQPGSKPNSLATGNNAVMGIEITGDGLEFYGGLTTVRGLVLNGGNFGIYFGERKGGAVSGHNLVEGCFVGVNSAGNIARKTRAYGIIVTKSEGDRIGGSAPAARNVIAAAGYAGIGLLEAAQGTVIQGNYIGLDAAGAAPIPNAAVGVYSEAGANARILIGGSEPGQGNVIAFNGGPGVLIYIGSAHTISGNSIFGNGGIGINLGGEGSVNDEPQINDPDDLDTGANDLQNSPVITQVT